MRKLIEKTQVGLVTCDSCDYSIPYTEEKEKGLIKYVGKPCPKCGQNLLTIEDYLLHERINRTVDWINKWFSWITLFYSKKAKSKLMSVHVHDGVTIKEVKPKTE